MTKRNEYTSSLTRRSFMGGAISTGVLTLATPSLVRDALAAGGPKAGSPRREVLTGTHWGVLRARVEAGHFVEAVPFEKDRFPASLVKYTPDHVYSAARVKHPMVRAGFRKLRHKSDTSERGRGAFVRASWDEALELIANELVRVKQAHGPAAIYGRSGWKSAGRLHNSATGLARLLNLHGGYTASSGSYSVGASSVVLRHVMGGTELMGQPTVWPVVVESSELVVLWGADPMTTLKVAWGLPDHAGQEGLEDLKRSGAKVIAIDPFRSDSAEYLAARWIAPRPGSDVALMLGIAHTLHAEKLFDRGFCDRYTVGFDRFEAYLLGQTDERPKTAEWAAQVCDIEAEAIRGLAREMAKSRTMLMSGWSMQRAQHGEQVHWMLAALAAMLGQIGLPGGGFGLSYHTGGGSPGADSASLGGLSAGRPPPGAPSPVPIARISDALLHPGATVDYNGGKLSYPDIRLVYWAGGNPFHHQQDRNKLVRAWRKPETVIVHEQFWTPTAKFADIVLPATTSFERNDLEQGGAFSNRYIFPMHKVIDPLFEARNDYDIFAQLAERLGFGQSYSEGKSEMQWLESIYAQALRQAKAKRLEMPSFSAFWQSGSYVEFPVPESSRKWVRHADFRSDPLLNPLGTPSGKIELYSKSIEKMRYDDCPPHPSWIEPAEWLGSPKARQHPLHLLSPHPTDRLHSQANHSPLRTQYAVAGREPVWLNPSDAKTRGIEHGDLVRVFNGRGQILAGALLSERLRPGVVRIREGGWYDPMDPGQPNSLCKHGDVNVLTLDQASSKLSQATVANTVLVEIEKFRGEAPAVTAFDSPTI